jgi:superfamily II RNA helicase
MRTIENKTVLQAEVSGKVLDDDTSEIIQFPYPLDPFQRTSIEHIRRDEHVLVAAHTSAGKSTVAEFGVNWCLKKGLRIVYTAPIKALSNQKYADFRKKARSGMFACSEEEIGIVTGDVQNNPDGRVIIATTEIIHNYLYTNTAYFDDVGVVVFDEVHYINDYDRGKVWEGSIVMMPAHVTMVMLSATIPRAEAFAGWIREVKAPKPVGLVTTDYRPVPLQHYLFWEDELHLVYDEHGRHADTYERIKRSIDARHRAAASQQQRLQQQRRGGGEKGGGSSASSAGGAKEQKKKPKLLKPPSESYLLNRAVKYLEEADKLPGFFFCFSRKKCHAYAHSVQHPVSDGKTITRGVNRYRELVRAHVHDDDRGLPQVQEMERFIGKGVAVHHSGLLPILKEIVERLFEEKFVQVLFVTETFAVGINLATRCVVLTDVRKHDGYEKRNLAAHEYQQIAGRAGRRGLDSGGTVVLLPLQRPLPSVDAYAMISGAKQPIQSKFELDAHFLLTAMLSETQTVKGVLESTLMARELSQQAAALGGGIEGAAQELERTTAAGAQAEAALTGDAQYQEYVRLKAEAEKTHTQAKGARRDRQAFEAFCESLERSGSGSGAEEKWAAQAEAVALAARRQQEHARAVDERAMLRDEIAVSARTTASLLEEMGHLALPDDFERLPNDALLAAWPGAGALSVKGRVCALFHECPPLLAAEWVTSGQSDGLSGEEIAMVLATLLGERHSETVWSLNTAVVPQRVQQQVNALYETNQEIGAAHLRRRLRYTADNNVVMHMAEHAARWVRGDRMATIMAQSAEPIDEGNFVRSMLKLYNMVEEMRSAYALLGHPNEQKMVGLGPRILRGAVRVDSLYY